MLALTLGDPASIAPEIILQALGRLGPEQRAQVTVIGERWVLQQAYQDLKGQVQLLDPEEVNVWDVGCLPRDGWVWGQGSAQTGAASFAYLRLGIEGCLQGQFQGLVTAPIAKWTWQLAGHAFPGQTEVLAALTGTQEVGMAFVARSPHTGWILRVLLATTHIPLEAVPTQLTPAGLQTKLHLLKRWLRQDWALDQPRIAVAGLNPHSGEGGSLGREEQDWIEDLLVQEGVQGPVPADSLWITPAQAWYRDPRAATADAYVALYHDQGLIPVKLLAFDQAVNTTLGLPFVRTSPDHGTAFDLAGRGVARPDSLLAALTWAFDLTAHRSSTVMNTPKVTQASP
ncbi:MAG: 4-hydroxythreonine-4-phosphate dehydrogenase PdxA [Thermostichales cyanobacterium SZTDM-1c_bins_54]